jgi:hypothetical protein
MRSMRVILFYLVRALVWLYLGAASSHSGLEQWTLSTRSGVFPIRFEQLQRRGLWLMRDSDEE